MEFGGKSSSTEWISIELMSGRPLSLSILDQATILNGDLLNDRHIFFPVNPIEAISLY